MEILKHTPSKRIVSSNPPAPTSQPRPLAAFQPSCFVPVTLCYFFNCSSLKAHLKHVMSPLDMSVCLSSCKGLFFKRNSHVPCHTPNAKNNCLISSNSSLYSYGLMVSKVSFSHWVSLTQGPNKVYTLCLVPASPLVYVAPSPFLFTFVFTFVFIFGLFLCAYLVGEARFCGTEVGTFFCKGQRVNILGFEGIESLLQLLKSVSVLQKQS